MAMKCTVCGKKIDGPIIPNTKWKQCNECADAMIKTNLARWRNDNMKKGIRTCEYWGCDNIAINVVASIPTPGYGDDIEAIRIDYECDEHIKPMLKQGYHMTVRKLK